jgi:ubiquinone/menaquinone biosynthesis C-methylase UbiE
MIEKPEVQSLESEKQSSKIFAEHKVGLYRPEDLHESLREIAEANGLPEWGKVENSDYLTSYYLGYAIMTQLMRHQEDANPTKPFLGVDRLSLPETLLKKPTDILRFGCASESSHLLEREALLSMGVQIGTHITVDMCKIPLTRCNLINNDSRFSFCQGDASNLDSANASMDLATTDLLLGSMPREKEVAILNDVRRVLRPDGTLLMKVMAGTSSGNPSEDLGLQWRTDVIKKYGEDGDCDNYIGLMKNQWEQLGQNYRSFILQTYDGSNKYEDLNEIKQILMRVGFKTTDVQKIDNDMTDPGKGFFALLAEKV